MTETNIGLERVTLAQWQRAHRQGYARIWDTHRYMLRLDRETGATVWRPVEVIFNVSRPYSAADIAARQADYPQGTRLNVKRALDTLPGAR